MKNNRKLTYMGLGIALYVVLSFAVRIPLINRIRTDPGYLVFGLFLCLFGWQAAPVGILGCIISNLLNSGTFPLGWAIGQTFIGLSCGFLFQKVKSTPLRLLIGAVSVFLGIGVIKTVTESLLFDLPLAVKFVRGAVASVADAVPFLAGILLSTRIHLPDSSRK